MLLALEHHERIVRRRPSLVDASAARQYLREVLGHLGLECEQVGSADELDGLAGQLLGGAVLAVSR